MQVQRKPGVDSTQIQHVGDEPPGAPRVGLQKARSAVLTARLGVGFTLTGAARQLFGSSLHTGNRGAQLVRGVDEELPGRALGTLRGLRGLLGPQLRGFQRVQHPVESTCRAAQFGIGAIGAQPPAAITGRDVFGQRGEPLQRPQCGPADRDQQQRRHHQGRQARADHQLTQLAGHLRGLRGVGDQDHPGTVGQFVHHRGCGGIWWETRRRPRWRWRRRAGRAPPRWARWNRRRVAGQCRDRGTRGGVGTDPGITVGGAVGGDQQGPHAAAVELGGEQIGRRVRGSQRVRTRGGRHQPIVQISPGLQAQAHVDGDTEHHQQRRQQRHHQQHHPAL